MFYKVERALKVYIKHAVKVRFAHFEQEIVGGHAGVVDKHADRAKLLENPRRERAHALEIGNVASAAEGAHAKRRNGLLRGLRGVVVAGVNKGYVVTALGELKSAAAPDSARSAGYKSYHKKHLDFL
jgi:hypothetical protein